MAQDYLLVRRLADGQTTAFQPYWLRRRGYLRFDKKGVKFVRTNSMDEERGLCQDPSVWALIDDDPIDEFGWCEDRDWLCIWSASPEKLSSSTWQKEVNAEVLYLDSWTLGELAAAR